MEIMVVLRCVGRRGEAQSDDQQAYRNQRIVEQLAPAGYL